MDSEIMQSPLSMLGQGALSCAANWIPGPWGSNEPDSSLDSPEPVPADTIRTGHDSYGGRASDMNAIKIVGPSGLDWPSLRRLCQRPPLFAPHEVLFWDDPHIAGQMLEAHLDPEWEAASRPHAIIDRSVEWMVSHLPLQAGQHVLDIGCGPGLYCERLARRGLRVTGMDYSRNSIAYASARAREQGVDIEYIYQNYLTLDYDGSFDAVLLIFLDFCVLSDQDRDELLVRVRRALKPGGVFVFDVATPFRAVTPDGTLNWAVRPGGGFWKPGPHLELTAFFEYPEAGADLEQVVVVEEDGTASVFRLWNRGYTLEAISEVLSKRGFGVRDVWTDLTGTPYDPGARTMGVVAVKEGEAQ